MPLRAGSGWSVKKTAHLGRPFPGPRRTLPETRAALLAEWAVASLAACSTLQDRAHSGTARRREAVCAGFAGWHAD
jgi:hypothetical protein